MLNINDNFAKWPDEKESLSYVVVKPCDVLACVLDHIQLNCM